MVFPYSLARAYLFIGTYHCSAKSPRVLGTSIPCLIVIIVIYSADRNERHRPSEVCNGRGSITRVRRSFHIVHVSPCPADAT